MQGAKNLCISCQEMHYFAIVLFFLYFCYSLDNISLNSIEKEALAHAHWIREGQDELKGVGIWSMPLDHQEYYYHNFNLQITSLFWKSECVKESFMGPAYYMNQIKPLTKALVLSLCNIIFKFVFPSHVHCAREIFSDMVLSYLL